MLISYVYKGLCSVFESLSPSPFSDGLCATLSDAIKSGRQDQSAEIVKKMATQNLHLSIKLKNPTLVTMDSGGNTIK